VSGKPNHAVLTLDNLFRSAVRTYGDRPALVSAGRRFSYTEFGDVVSRLAGYLAVHGIGAGDPVSAFLTNGPELPMVMFACARLGAVFNPVNYRLGPSELLYILEDASARVLFFDDAGRDVVERIRGKVNGPLLLVYVGNQDTGYADSFYAAVNVQERYTGSAAAEEQDCLLLYTSGTTGKPKGVLHTQRNVVLTGMTWLLYNRIGPADRVTMLGALYHIGPLLSIFLPAVLAGAAFHIAQGSDPLELLQFFKDSDITTVWGVPTVVNEISSRAIARGMGLPLRLIQYSGAPMPVAVLAKIKSAFGNVSLVNAYGMTECDAVTALWAEEHDSHPGSIGRAVPNTEVRLVAVGSRDIDARVATGELGEVVVKSPVVMSGYHRLPGKTVEVLVDEWYFTGDVARCDKDGYLYLEGRVDDLIISGGENISPVEVENVLYKHPKVKDVSVVGIPDEKWGEVVTAFVVGTDESLTSAELDQFCKNSDELARYKRPRKYIFLRDLPKTGSGKIDKKPLKGGDIKPYQVITERGDEIK